MVMHVVRPEIAAIVDKIDAIRPELIKNAPEGDKLRRVHPDSFKALAQTGVFGVSAPTKFGGLAANTAECLALSHAIARGDSGAAWVNGILDSGAWVVSLMSDQAQEDVWGKEGALDSSFISIVLATSSEATLTDGGYRVSGKWHYGTGSSFAEWSLLGIPLVDEEGNVVDAGLALIPASDLSVEDNWYVAGMKSTGSVSQIAEDVFVPAHRVLPLTAAVEGGYVGSNDEQTYKTIFVPSLFMKLVGPHLGMGRAALDFVIEKAESKSIAYTGYAKQSEAVSFQMAIAKASAQLNAAELVAFNIANKIYEGAGRGEYAPYSERIEMRAQVGWLVETITEMINSLVTAHGSAGFADVAPLQRIWRDQAASSRHGHLLSASGYEALGKIIFNREDEAKHVLPIV